MNMPKNNFKKILTTLLIIVVLNLAGHFLLKKI
jgi:hypothetical protein